MSPESCMKSSYDLNPDLKKKKKDLSKRKLINFFAYNNLKCIQYYSHCPMFSLRIFLKRKT